MLKLELTGRALGLALSGCVLACTGQPTDRATTDPLAGVHAKVSSISVSAPPRADMIHSPGLLRFVGGDEAAAVRMTNNLLETNELLSRTVCSEASADPARLRELLRTTERDILYVVIFSLAYEFDFGQSATMDDGPKRSLAILHALDERLETSSILFPKLELLTPEDAALLVDSHSAEELSLFPTYVELLYSMSTANADLADKKARIAAKIVELRDAVALLYLRGERADSVELCPVLDTLASASSDALLWAVSDVQRTTARTAVAAAYRVEVSVAVTNTWPDRTLMIGPRAEITVRHDDDTTATFAVEDTRLADQDLLDNNVPPGFTQVRSFEGMAQKGVVQGCALELKLVVDGEPRPLAVSISDCAGI